MHLGAQKASPKDLLSFRVGETDYCMDVLAVREIINPLPVTPLPTPMPEVLGVADYREQLLAVVDLRRMFGIALHPNTSAKWIVCQDRSRLVAMVVDAVNAVLPSKSLQSRDVGRWPDAEPMPGIVAAYRHGAGLVFQIDLELLAAPAFRIPLDEGAF